MELVAHVKDMMLVSNMLYFWWQLLFMYLCTLEMQILVRYRLKNKSSRCKLIRPPTWTSHIISIIKFEIFLDIQHMIPYATPIQFLLLLDLMELWAHVRHDACTKHTYFMVAIFAFIFMHVLNPTCCQLSHVFKTQDFK